jgi:hypothetical protein
MKTIPALLVLILTSRILALDHISLAGEWRFALDPKDHGAKATPEQWRFPDAIRLPGTVAAQGFGEKPSMKTAWTGDGWRYPEMFKEWQADDHFKFPFFLQPPLHYVGPAWYQREFEIPDHWQDQGVTLHLERVHWASTVWIDGIKAGEGDSLGTPHEFDLGKLAPGKHVITLRVDNRMREINVGPLSHSMTDHTQGNWNGVVGRMELRRHARDNRIHGVRVFPAADGSVKLRISGQCRNESIDGPSIVVRDPDAGLAVVGRGVPKPAADGSFDLEITAKPAAPFKTWDEFSPHLYRWTVEHESGDDMPFDRKEITFGFREVGTRDGRITLNGRKVFLRGTLECCIFPLTGHPPADVESWKRIIRICKEHGLNHIRFHSWCPPEAAFVAADELGFYYQVEVSSWANQGAEIGSGTPLDEWIEKESLRMIDAYGNHPSFLLMAYGNEPAGKNHAKWLQQWVARRKAEDPRRLYTTGAGWPVMPGSDFHSTPKPRIQQWGERLKSILNGQPPRTDFDWRERIAAHGATPVISHEIGQWCVYPNFREIEKYTGYFKARNFEIFRETARRNGLLDQAEDFLMASGKLQTLAYKHDIEAALRTPGFGGFQLLDLHDFPGQGTALVGVLDAFWDSKGYVTAEEYRRFCGPVVPLVRMPKMVFTTAETLDAEVELAQFGPRDLSNLATAWSLVATGGEVVAEGRLAAKDLTTGDLHTLGRIKVPLTAVRAPAKLKLRVFSNEGGFANDWDLFVYQDRPEETPAATVLVTRDAGEAKTALAAGRKVLWCPPADSIADDPSRPLVAGFSPIFWNTAWTNWQAPHTLGILCDPAHPALAAFPTDAHSNWQWWEPQQGARPFILTKHPDLRPVVQVIDDWFTNRRLGYVFEAKVGKGRLMACAVDLTRTEGKPVIAQLRHSVIRHMEGDGFDPKTELTPADIDALIRKP